MPSYIVIKRRACYCREQCDVCTKGSASPAALRLHNVRVACHGERSYPSFPERDRVAEWNALAYLRRL